MRVEAAGGRCHEVYRNGNRVLRVGHQQVVDALLDGAERLHFLFRELRLAPRLELVRIDRRIDQGGVERAVVRAGRAGVGFLIDGRVRGRGGWGREDVAVGVFVGYV